MQTDEIKIIASFWINNIDTLVNRINMAIIDDTAEEIISDYKSMLKIQSESEIYSKFNKKFNELTDQIYTKFLFDPSINKTHRVLLPDLKKSNYNQWMKERFELINRVNNLKEVFDDLVEKHIKAKVSVEGIIPTYDGVKQAIFFNEHQVELERDSKEHAYCDVLFNHMQKEQNMSWDVFWETMEGAVEKTQDPQKTDKKMVYDTLNRVNKKIQNKFKNKNISIAKWVRYNVVRKF